MTGIWEITDAEYYADTTHVSHSMLEIFRRSIPEFAGRFITKTIPAPEPTPAMQFGTLLHTACLEPAKWAARLVVPMFDGRTTKGKEIKAGIELALARGDLAVSQEDNATIEAMRSAVMAHEYAGPCLRDPGMTEKPIRWVRGGVMCKGKPDRVLTSGLIVDIKTAADPSPREFAKAMANFGWARQAEWYLSGARLALGAEGPFVFIAVGKSLPHEVVTYTLDALSLTHAGDQNCNDLDRLRGRMETSRWDSAWPDIQTISLPRWALTEE